MRKIYLNMSGFTNLFDNIKKYEDKSSKKKKVFRWQELAEKICIDFKVPKGEQGLIYKICYELPESFVEHCYRETKELAKGDKRHHYFVKVVYKKPEENKTP